jgi:phage terminase large subunit GpA-like protein
LHFCSDLDEEYFQQLTAEKRITKFVRGRKTLVWKQVRPRNEALDTLVYNFAAIYILNPNYDTIETKIMAQPLRANKTPKKRVVRENFATSWKK